MGDNGLKSRYRNMIVMGFEGVKWGKCHLEAGKCSCGGGKLDDDCDLLQTAADGGLGCADRVVQPCSGGRPLGRSYPMMPSESCTIRPSRNKRRMSPLHPTGNCDERLSGRRTGVRAAPRKGKRRVVTSVRDLTQDLECRRGDVVECGIHSLGT
jgi:hypothetical protein